MKKYFLLILTILSGLTGFAQATTKVQIIHNCADLAADSVDIYIGAAKVLDNFAFRTATSYIDAPAGTLLTIGIAPKSSMSVMDTIFSITASLDAAKKYIVIANGIVSPSGYTPGRSTVPFRLSLFDAARLRATTAGTTDVLVMHGSTDAPTVDVKAGGITLVDNISFGQFCGTGYISAPAADLTVDITDATGTTVVKRYSAPLATLGLGDSSITVIASGFLDSTMNSNGKKFGLWVALAKGGNLIPLPELPVSTGIASVNKENMMKVYPNPFTNIINVERLDNATSSLITIQDVTGKVVKEASHVGNISFDMSAMPSGVYFVRSTEADGSINTYKLVK